MLLLFELLNNTWCYIYSHADSGSHGLDDSVSSFSAPLSDSSERLLQALGGSPAITQLLGSPSTRTATLVCNNMLSILSSLKMIFWFHFHKPRYAHYRLSIVSIIAM